MRTRLLQWLECPMCHGDFTAIAAAKEADEILSGQLRCGGCGFAVPIRDGIPRFSDDAYAESFGLQWNRFRQVQIDSRNGTALSRRRFLSETGWTPESLPGKRLLDAGCGAGRFLEVAGELAGEVVGVDLSSAVDAARALTRGLPNVHLVQASIFELPLKPGVFDGVYSIGVIQHTPDPGRALAALPPLLVEGGSLAVTIYERKRWTMLYSKYVLRPLTRRLPPKLLLACIRTLMPIAFPVTEVLFRLPALGRVFRFLLPVANYVGQRELSWRQRYAWAVLDTFDMLAPRYDSPQRAADVAAELRRAGMSELTRLPTDAVNIVARKGRAPLHASA